MRRTALPRLTLWQRLTGQAPASAIKPTDRATDVNPWQKLVLHNTGPEPLEIMVEIIPDRYVLQPGDEMIIEADLNGAPFDITPYHLGMQIYPGNAFDPRVTINGMVADSDWTTPAHDAG